MGTIFSVIGDNLEDLHTLDKSATYTPGNSPKLDSNESLVQNNINNVNNMDNTNNTNNLDKVNNVIKSTSLEVNNLIDEVYILTEDDNIVCFDISKNNLMEYMNQLINQKSFELILKNLIIFTERIEKNNEEKYIIYRKDRNILCSLTVPHTIYKISKVSRLEKTCK